MFRIGIRREDRNEWERRAPLTPDHVAELVEQHGLDISVQPSSIRVFPDEDYRAAGARVDETMASCRVVLGVKEIPAHLLAEGTTYAFFSHTTKAQSQNMSMLRRLLQLGCTLIDYERVLDDKGRRLIFFGRYAGHAGMINALWALGRRLAAGGHATPFEHIRLAHEYASLDEATHHVARMGERLRHAGVPDRLHPLVCGFTGSGNVSRGAQEIFDRLPHVELDPEELQALADDRRRPRNVLYKTVFRREHRFERIAGGPFDAVELSAHPERYRGGLGRWLRDLTVLVHGAFWSPEQPKLVTLAGLRRMWTPERPRLRLIVDISCDVGGAIESTVRVATPGDPVYVYDMRSDEPVDGVRGHGPVVLAVDNLPCQLPVESSGHFGDTLVGFVPTLAECEWNRPLAGLELPRELAEAIIAHRGQLTPRYAYLAPHVS